MALDAPEVIAHRLKKLGEDLVSTLERETAHLDYPPISEERLARYLDRIKDAVACIDELAKVQEQNRIWNAAVYALATGTAMNTADEATLGILGEPAHLRHVRELRARASGLSRRLSACEHVAINARDWYKQVTAIDKPLLQKLGGSVASGARFRGVESAIAAFILQEEEKDDDVKLG